MGNDYKLCHRNTIQETNFCVQRTQVREVVNLVQTVHKTINQFLQDNQDFFDHDCIAIKHIILSNPSFQQQLNKFPIQRVNQHKRVFFPNLTKEQFCVYEGECLFLDFKNHQLYLGEVNCGRKYGQGIMINKNGNKYQGNWFHDMQNGEGTLEILYPKRTYKGNWKNGKLDGKGQAIYEDGAKYQGHFQHGKKNGMGILTFYDGTVYEGAFQNDLMNGFGTLTSIKGRQISGEWKNGKYQVSRPDRSSKTFSINQLPAI